MVDFSIGDTKKRLGTIIALIVLGLIAMAFSLRGSALESARDFEECVEAIGPSVSDRSSLPLGGERGGAMTDCNARFAGRRKLAGGYSYYDFMQGRSFDIAGPNPTVEERKQIDREYIGFLDAQRREAVSEELAKRQSQLVWADLEGASQPVGPPLILTPKNLSSPAAKRPVDRSRSARCQDNALACGWSKLSAVLKDTFASSSRTKP